MKSRIREAICIIFTILYSACASDDFPNDINPREEIHATAESIQLCSIRNYIISNRKATRGADFDIRPYIDENGDTLMFIVDYEEGWELFSNSLTAPMSLIKSDTGNFNSSLKSSNPIYSEIFDNLLLALKSDRQNPQSQDYDGAQQWISYASVPTPLPNPGSDQVKTLVGTKLISEEELHIPHMLTTKWGQEYPCNLFMPKDNTNEDSKGHIYVGCVPVATGQLLYYSHYKWGSPTLTPSHATYNSSRNKYEFSLFSSQQWDKMYLYAPYYPEEADPSVGLFLGWIAQSIKAAPKYQDGKHHMTTATLSNAADFIKDQTGYAVSVKGYNRHNVSNMIKNGKPVIFSLSTSDTDAGHAVVIDAMDYHETTYAYYYTYRSAGGTTDPDPTPAPPSTSTDPEYDRLVAQYGEITTEVTSYLTSYFKFNWGYYGAADDVYYISSDALSFIFHGQNGDITFKMSNYIDYDIK